MKNEVSECKIRIPKYSESIVSTGYIASLAVSATLNGVAPFPKHPSNIWTILNKDVID